jgi:pimeloyl-ACP methyl ester carboxylesterase
MRSEVAVLFIRGLNSSYILDEDRPLIKHHFPNYQLVSIEDAGHWLHAEQPDAFDAAVSHFFDL